MLCIEQAKEAMAAVLSEMQNYQLQNAIQGLLASKGRNSFYLYFCAQW